MEDACAVPSKQSIIINKININFRILYSALCLIRIVPAVYKLAMVVNLENVSPTFAQMPHSITKVEYTTVRHHYCQYNVTCQFYNFDLTNVKQLLLLI